MEGAQSCAYLALDSGLRLWGKGLQAPAVVPRYSSPRKSGKEQRLRPEPRQAGPASSRHVPPPGHLSGVPPCSGPSPRASLGAEEGGGPSPWAEHPLLSSLTSGDTSKPQAALAEADGHGRGLSHTLGNSCFQDH